MRASSANYAPEPQILRQQHNMAYFENHTPTLRIMHPCHEHQRYESHNVNREQDYTPHYTPTTSIIHSPMKRIKKTKNKTVGRYVRRIGRPRHDWCSELMREGMRLFNRRELEIGLTDASGDAQKRWVKKVYAANL